MSSSRTSPLSLPLKVEEKDATETGSGVIASEVEASQARVQVYDEGSRAWCTVAGAWLVQFCVLGLPLSFGVMESFYANVYLSNFTPSTINWIGSLQLCLQFLLGVVVAGVFDAGYFRWLSIAGSTLFIFSMFMLSLAKQEHYYQIFLAQGLGLGLAIGALYTPTSSAVSQHFRKKRGFAMGIITTGGALGGAFFSIILGHFLNGPIGFAWGVRICAFISLFSLTLANLLMRTNYPPPAPKPTTTSPTPSVGMPLNRLVRTTSYISYITFAFVISVALYNPMFSVELFALQNSHVSQNLGGYLLAILNVSSIFGRIIPNRLADRFGVFQVYIPCTVLAGLVALIMPKCTSIPSIIVFCILYGFFSGSAVALYFPGVLSLDRDVTRSGLRLGLASVPVGIASLIGTPIAGAVVGHNRWWSGAVFTGVLEFSAAGLLVISFLTKPKQ